MFFLKKREVILFVITLLYQLWCVCVCVLFISSAAVVVVVVVWRELM